jgi:hypothetical protein
MRSLSNLGRGQDTIGAKIERNDIKDKEGES